MYRCWSLLWSLSMKRDIRLLIVDDNIATRSALSRRLERHGYEVLEAGTGTEGLELIDSVAIDALILDVNLPDMSGFDIVRKLRAEPATALLPVIHVSAASIQTGDIITGLDAGADAYLIHPVDPDVLLATLRTLLRVRETENALRESEARFREIFVNVSAPIAVLDAELKVHECNHAFAQLTQNNLNPDTLRECFAEDQDVVIEELRLRLAYGERWKGTLSMRVHGETRETEWQISPYRTPELSLVFVEDVTEHRHRERSHLARLDDATTQLAKEVAERARTEAQLLQVQKMDALGKLTGGIAHDFNNLLTGIITSLELIQKRIAASRTDKVQFYAEAALNSAKSAASLTHRLLAFARQQPLDTQPVDMLPASTDPTAGEAESATVDHQGAGEHVLIVEDMPSVRMFVAEVLVDAGYRCTQVGDIEGALERLQNDESIDLLLTDVGLPRMSGRELADVARGWREKLPILFMTGYAETAINRQVFLGDGMEMLIKPFQINELLDKVRRTLDSA
jgi:PAS domain S-box-containing protein